MPRRKRTTTDSSPATANDSQLVPVAGPVPVTQLEPVSQDRNPNPSSLPATTLIRQTRTFFDTIGRDGVVHILEVVGGDDPKSPESRLVALLQDPSHTDTPLHLLCRRAGVPLAKLKEHFVSYQITEGTVRAYQHLPKIMEDTAVAATERTGPCPNCTDGIIIEDDASVPCRTCKATGSITLYPDPAARALMFDTAGLTKKGGGIVINNSNSAQFVSPTSFEDLMRESSRVIDITPGKDT